MKRIISIVCSLIFTSFLGMDHFTYAKETDLSSIASSLGADTDYLDIPNYKHNSELPFLRSVYEDFFSKCTNYEAGIQSEAAFFLELAAGTCYGISAIEVLSHNGIISPSDIKPNAQTLSEIQLSQEVDHFISGYHASQLHYENDYYNRFLITQLNKKNQCSELVRIAEKNMADGKYFIIIYYSSDTAHAVCGIGITDGNWNYNNTDFDKCVLTLDSNAFDHDTNSGPFSERSCIYINSQTNDYYIPKYNFGSTSSSQQVQILANDNMNLINYKGVIEPTKDLDFDFTDTARIYFTQSRFKKYDAIAKSKDGVSTDIIKEGRKYEFRNDVGYYITGNEFHIETDNKLLLGEAHNDKFNIINQRYYFSGEIEKNHGIFDINDTEFTVSTKNDKAIIYDVNVKYNEGYYSCTPHFNWAFNGETDNDFKSILVDKGFILHSDGTVKTHISTSDVLLDEHDNIADININPNEAAITAVNDVFVTFDENNKLCFFIDPDNDGTFDTAIEKGDVNSDGVTDGRDATSVLTDYAKKSADKNAVSYLNECFADFNDDSIIDGRDATAILTFYAYSSTNK